MVGTSLDPDLENDANSNEYVLAKISFDTAENEPSKFGKFWKMLLRIPL